MIFPFNCILPDWRKGSVLSRIFRSIFEKRQIKKILGLNLAFTMAFLGVLSPAFGNTDLNLETQEQVITLPQSLTTEVTFQRPVIGEISQGFSWYHPGVDIAKNDNAQVYPVAAGKVIEVGYQFWGYGKYVVIQHGEEMTSKYAHLKLVNAKVNQEVNKDSILGIVGSTGRSTGAHLHLEIDFQDQRINPFLVIEDL